MKNRKYESNHRYFFCFIGLVTTIALVFIFTNLNTSEAVIKKTKPEKSESPKAISATIKKIPTNIESPNEFDESVKKKALDSMKNMVRPFIENRGQMDDQVAYYLQTQGGSIFLTKKGEAVFSFTKRIAPEQIDKSEHTYPHDARRGDSRIALHDARIAPHDARIALHDAGIAPHDAGIPPHDAGIPQNSKQIEKSKQILPPHEIDERQSTRKRIVFKIIPETSSNNINAYGQNKAKAIVNYFIGKKENWKGAIPTYHEVAYDGLFPGTKAVYRSGPGHIEDIYELAPGADPAKIRFRIEGANGLKKDNDGNLLVKTAAGEFMIKAPFAYQENTGKRFKIDCSFIVDGLSYGFKIGAYNVRYALLIDPELIYGTFLGGVGSGNGIDHCESIEVDSNGRTYLVGNTDSSDYPFTSESFDESHHGSRDIFLTVLDPHGNGASDIVYSTFLGGGSSDSGYGITVSGRLVYITGSSSSSDYPVTTGAYDESYNGGTYIPDAILSIIDPQGGGVTDLIYSTYVGGDDTDQSNSVAVSEGLAYITGYTYSSDYPVTAGAYNESNNGRDEIFLSVISPQGEGAADLVYSTYIGGGGDDYSDRVAVSEGLAYITGASSFGYPVTVGAYDESYNGGEYDVFLSVINPQGGGASDLVYSTFIGGGDYDNSNDFEISEGLVYIAGSTDSSDYPITSGAYDESYNGWSDIVLSVINPQGEGSSDLVYSTFIGSDRTDVSIGVAISEGLAFLTGYTESSDYPVTIGAFDESFNELQDIFLTVIDIQGGGVGELLYSTFLGGSGYERSYGVKVSGGLAYVAGFTTSFDFPVTSGAYDEFYNGYDDVVLSVINPQGHGASDLVYSTFIGGGDSIESSSDVVASGGLIYITGHTGSLTYPITVGAYDETYNSDRDVFLSVIDPQGEGAADLVYSTFIGGIDEDYGESVAVSEGLTYITGYTKSSDYPTTAGAYDETHNGFGDVFLSILDIQGNGLSDLVYSTFLGGEGWDAGKSIVISEGLAYITGSAYSSDYPVTIGAYDDSFNGNGDIFLSVIAPLSQGDSDLIYSTFLGHSELDFSYDLTVSQGLSYITGFTESINYPVTIGAYDESYNGVTDVFFSVIAPRGNGASDLIYSTFIGGNDIDYCYGISLSRGLAYITGFTESSDYPTTPGAYDESYNGDFISSNVFLSVIDPRGNGAADLTYSTFIGGSSWNVGHSVVVSGGLAYITGSATSDYPTTAGAYDESWNGNNDAFFSVIDPQSHGVADLVYSTFLGGDDYDSANGISISNGAVYITGATESSDFPVTSGAYDETVGRRDAFLIVMTFPTTADIFGTVFYQTGSALDALVPNTVVTIVGEETYTTESDVDGIYNINSIPTGDYTLVASKDDDVNGITAYDAARVAQYAAELYEFDEYQILAADVTGNGEVTAFDAARIAQYAAEIDHGTLAGSWAFIPEEYNYEPLDSDLTDQDFTAILYGEVTGNWLPSNRNFKNDDATISEVIAFQFTLQTKSDLGESFVEKFETAFPDDWNVVTSQRSDSFWYVGGYGVTSISENKLRNNIEAYGLDSKEFSSFCINDKRVADSADKKSSGARIAGNSGGCFITALVF